MQMQSHAQPQPPLLPQQQQMQVQPQQHMQLAHAYGTPPQYLHLQQQSGQQSQFALASQSSSSVKAYVANRFRKAPAVILTGSPIRPKPRPPPPPPPAAVKHDDGQSDQDDEPSFISELIRGATTASNNSSQDPYNSFFDDIKGWEEDVPDDDLVMKLLSATSSACYKYLTVGDPAAMPGVTSGTAASTRAEDERPPVPPPSAARRRPVRRKTAGPRESVPVLRATIEDDGEESSLQSSSTHSLREKAGIDGIKNANNAGNSINHPTRNRSDAFSSNVGAEDDSFGSFGHIQDANSDPRVAHQTNAVSALDAQHQSDPLQHEILSDYDQLLPKTGTYDSNPSLTQKKKSNASDIPDLQTQSSTSQDRMSQSAALSSPSAEASKDTILNGKDKSVFLDQKMQRNSFPKQDQPSAHTSRDSQTDLQSLSKSQSSRHTSSDSIDSTEPQTREKQRARPATSRRDIFDPYRSDSIALPATERMALMRKKLISSATSAKLHWRSSQSSANTNGKLVADPLSLTVITGRKYHKNDPSDRHGHLDDTPSASHRRPQTAGAALCESNRQSRNNRFGSGSDMSSSTKTDKSSLPRIAASGSAVHIVPGDSAINPVVRGLVTLSKHTPSLSEMGLVHNNMMQDEPNEEGLDYADQIGRDRLYYSAPPTATGSLSRIHTPQGSEHIKSGVISSSDASMLLVDSNMWSPEMSLFSHPSLPNDRLNNIGVKSLRQQPRNSMSKRIQGSAAVSSGIGQPIPLDKFSSSDIRSARVPAVIPPNGIIITGAGSSHLNASIDNATDHIRSRPRPSTSFPDASGSHVHPFNSLRSRRDTDANLVNDMAASGDGLFDLRITKAPQIGAKSSFRSFRDQVEMNRNIFGGSSHRPHVA